MNAGTAEPPQSRAIGRRIQAERTRREWDQSELARKAGVSHAYINKLEGGRIKRPGLDTLSRVAGAMGLSVLDIAGASPPPGNEALIARVAAIVSESDAKAGLVESIVAALERHTGPEQDEFLASMARILQLHGR